MRNAATQVVFDLVKQDKRVMALTADNRNEIYDRIRTEFPNQYIDYGIAEANMVASAAGLASCGKIPFLYTITNFMSMRAFEFIRNDVCIGCQNVKFLGRSSGLVSSSMGPTHQGTEELALLRTLPNMLVITPASPIEAREAVKYAYRHCGPVYLRLEGFREPELYEDGYEFKLGKGRIIKQGKDAAIIAMGSVIQEALRAAKLLSEEGITVRVINMPMVRPIDWELILDAVKETGLVITLEEHSIYGGLGSAVAECIAESGRPVKFFRMGLDCIALGCGNRQDVREINHLSCEDIVEQIKKKLIRGKK